MTGLRWTLVTGSVFAILACATVPEGSVPVADEVDLALDSVRNVTQVMQLTGADSPNQTDRYVVHGTDLGSMLEHDGRIYIVFGDTFGPRPVGHTGGGGSLWRSNALAYTYDRDASDGITIDGWITDSTGTAREVVASPKTGGEITRIPTHGVSANGNIYLYFMSVRQWGDHGQWQANHAGVARSTDDGQTFEIVQGLQWPGQSGFIQVAIAPHEDHLYFWTIPAGRFGGTRLMRVTEEAIEDLDAYEYYTGVRRGEPQWSRRMEDAALIIEAPVGELSVAWSSYLERWIVTYLNEATRSIELREARDPWGPWSAPYQVAHASRYPGLYGAYMHPAYFEDDGRIIYFNMSQWLPYNVYVMRAELVRRE
jgi:hypothetical protein